MRKLLNYCRLRYHLRVHCHPHLTAVADDVAVAAGAMAMNLYHPKVESSRVKISAYDQSGPNWVRLTTWVAGPSKLWRLW